jgi:hypothetical protein
MKSYHYARGKLENQARLDALIAERDKLKEALEKIKFRTLPGTTNHELAKEALSRTSEEA